MNRRVFVFSFVALASMPRGFTVNRDMLHHEPSEAFLAVYKIMIRENWHDIEPLFASLESLVKKAGFTLHIGNVLVDLSNKEQQRSCTIYPNGEVEYTRNGKSEVYTNVDDAIFGIYGVHKIL